MVFATICMRVVLFPDLSSILNAVSIFIVYPVLIGWASSLASKAQGALTFRSYAERAFVAVILGNGLGSVRHFRATGLWAFNDQGTLAAELAIIIVQSVLLIFVYGYVKDRYERRKCSGD